jgi:hypothetical protein
LIGGAPRRCERCSTRAEDQLQPRLDAILAEANTVDQELATAINMADGDIPVPPNLDNVQLPGSGLDTPPPGQNAATGQWQLDRSHGYDGPSQPAGPYPAWQPTTIPQKVATGPTTGLLTTDKTGLGDTADGFDLQQGYKIRLTGGQFTGITKMVQGTDGKWYQARWIENSYEMQTTKVLQGTGDLGGITGCPIDLAWKPVSLSEIMNTSAMYPGKTFYLPDGCGGTIPMVSGALPTPTVPILTLSIDHNHDSHCPRGPAVGRSGHLRRDACPFGVAVVQAAGRQSGRLCHRASRAGVQPVATRTETFGGTGLRCRQQPKHAGLPEHG